MKTVRLYGDLAEKFGREWKLDVSTPAEAVRAIEANHPGFAQHIIESDKQGVGFHVVVGDDAITADDVASPFSKREVLHIVPIIGGAKKGGIFQIIVGIVLIVASFYTGGATASLLFSMGSSLALGGVAQLLAGTPKTPDDQGSAAEEKPSYYFNGPAEGVNQGAPVPIGYGELIVGSQSISRGFTTENLI